MNKCGPQETSSEVCVANPRFLRNQKLTWYVSPGVVLRSSRRNPVRTEWHFRGCWAHTEDASTVVTPIWTTGIGQATLFALATGPSSAYDNPGSGGLPWFRRVALSQEQGRPLCLHPIRLPPHGQPWPPCSA